MGHRAGVMYVARTNSWCFGIVGFFYIWLLALRSEPGVFGDPLFGFFLGIKFAEVAWSDVRTGVRPRYFDAPIARLLDRRQRYTQRTSP